MTCDYKHSILLQNSLESVNSEGLGLDPRIPKTTEKIHIFIGNECVTSKIS
jgi:hypothetical protein